jgi:hypothetical protein
MCGATRDFRFGPQADIDTPIDSRNEAARNKGRVTGRRQEVDGRMSLVTRLAARPIPILNLRVGLSSWTVVQ